MITYCKDYRRAAIKGYPVKFDFLGYSFKPMPKKSNRGGMFLGFDCELSMKFRTSIISHWKAMNFHRPSTQSIQSIATTLNPQVRGNINYYSLYNKEAVKSL